MMYVQQSEQTAAIHIKGKKKKQKSYFLPFMSESFWEIGWTCKRIILIKYRLYIISSKYILYSYVVSIFNVTCIFTN